MQPVLEKYSAYLLDLIGFGFVPVRLYINDFVYVFVPVYEVASLDSVMKA